LYKMSAAKEKLNSHGHRLNSTALQNIKMQNLALNNLENSLTRNVRATLEQQKQHLLLLEKELNRLSPNYYLERGYTRTESNGIPIHKANIQQGDKITTFTFTQKITSTIQEITSHDQ